MAKVGELSFDFTLDTSKVGQAFTTVENRVGQLESRLAKVGGSGLALNTREAEASVTSLDRKVGGLGDTMQRIVGVVAGFAVVRMGMQAIGNAFGFAKQAAIEFNDVQLGALKGFTSMLGSAEQAQNMLGQLKQFAASTPFEFEGLLKSSQQLMAFGIAADQVIPLLTDIGNASAYFHSGQQGIQSMTYAIGQMNSAVVLHTQDLMQLTNVGVPVWQILADGMGKTVPEIRKMVENGQIASSTFIDLFDQWAKAPERADQMKQANSTLEGSMSTIHDQVQFLIADAFKPFYNVLTMVSNKIAAFVSEDAFSAWGPRIATVVQGVMDAFGAIPEMLGRIRDVWSGFVDDFKRGGIGGVLDDLADNFSHLFDNVGKAFNSGGIVAALGQLMGNLLDKVIGYGPDWLQAGATLMETFAQGMWDAVTSTVSQVFNAVADYIGSFFIGASPPPNGPLSEIETGGRILMETYAQGMAAGTDGVKYVAQSVTDILQTIDSRGLLDGVITGIQQGSFSLDQLKDAAGSVNDAIAAIDGAEQQLNYTIDDTQLKIDTINQSYDAQIEPLQKAVDLLAQQRDYQQEMLDMQLQLKDVNLRIEEHNDTQLQSLIKQKTAAEAAVKGIKTTTDPATVQRLADLQHSLAGMPNDKAHTAARKAIQDQIEGLKYQSTTQGNLTKQQKDAAQANLDSINQQIEAIQSGYQARQEDIKFQRDGIALSQEKGKIESEIAQAPDLQKIDELNKKRKQELDPLNKQLDALNAQKKLLDDQKKVWEDIKKVIDPVVAQMEKANKEAEAAAKKATAGAGGSAAKKGLPELPTSALNIPHQSLLDTGTIQKSLEGATDAAAASIQARMQAKAQEIGGKLLTQLSTFMKNNWGRVFGGVFGGLIGGTFGPLGALAGSALGTHLGQELQNRLRGVDWAKVRGTLQTQLGKALTVISNVAKTVSDDWKKYGPEIMTNLRRVKDDFTTMANAIWDGLQKSMPAIREDLLPALGKLAYILGFVVLPAAMDFISWWALNVMPTLIAFYSNVLAKVVDGLILTATWISKNEDAMKALKIVLDIIMGIMLANRVYDFARAMEAAATATANWAKEALRAPRAITQTISQTFTASGKALDVAGDVTRTITEKLKLVGEDLAIRAMLLTDKVVNITENLIQKGSSIAGSIGDRAANLIENLTITGVEAAQTAVAVLQAALDALANKVYDIKFNISQSGGLSMPGAGGGGMGDQIASSVAAQIAKSAPQMIGSALGSALVAGIAAVSLPVAAVAGLVLALVGLIVLYIMRPEIPGAIAGAWAGILFDVLVGIPLLLANWGQLFVVMLVGLVIDGFTLAKDQFGTIGTLLGGLLRDAFSTAIQIATIIFVEMPSRIIGALAKMGPDIGTFFHAIITGDWGGAIRAALNIVVDLFVKFPLDVLRILAGGLGDIVGAIGTFAGNAKERFGTFFSETVANVTAFGKNVVGEFATFFSNALSAWLRFASDLLSNVGTNFQNVKDKIVALLGGAMDFVTGWLGTFWQSFKDKFDTLATPVIDGLTQAKDSISTILNAAYDNVIEPAWKKITDLFTNGKQGLLDAIKWPFEQARDGIGTIVEAFKNNMATPWNAAANGINGFIGGFADAINWVAGKLQLKFTIDTNNITKIPTFATGGVTPGGPIIVGEQGPELMFPGAGHGILSHDKSVAALQDAMPPFWGGPLDVASNLWNQVGKIKGEAGRAVSAFVKKGLDAIVNEAMKVAGIDGGLLNDAGSFFKDIGGAVFGKMKDGLSEFVKDLLDQSKGHIGGSTGTWVFPVPGGSPGQGSFGSYSHSKIAAVDIGAARGSTIVAPDGGEIMFDGQNGWSGGTGHTMMMQHDNDWYTLYGHVSAVLGKVGDAFEQGEAVARVGAPEIDGGIGEGAHLHFEMFHPAYSRVRPEDYIPGWGGGSRTNAYYMGGTLTEPVDGVGRWSKQPYSFAERGIETVSQGGGNGGGDVHVHGDVNISVATQPGQDAKTIADYIHEEFVVDVRRGGYSGA